MAQTIFLGEGHSFKTEGGNVTIILQFHVRLIYHENMKQLSCIVSEYWPGQDLDRQDGQRRHQQYPSSQNLAEG